MSRTKSELAVNTMSDHRAQVNMEAHTVSQNLQMPYAIKKYIDKQGKFTWQFDLPYPLTSKQRLEKFQEITGWTVPDCQEFLRLMNNQIPADDPMKTELIVFLTNLSVRYPGIGDLLGEGNHRISIESYDHLEKRLNTQIDLLLSTYEIKPVQAVMLQEQYYDTRSPSTRFEQQKIDQETIRMNILMHVMRNHHLVQVGRLDYRDVGIWVPEENASNCEQVVSSENALSTISQFTNLLQNIWRGYAIIDKKNKLLLINIHGDRWKDQNDQVTKLIELKHLAEIVAKENGLEQIVLHGDLNLYQLRQDKISALKAAGFTVEPVKGQEQFAALTPTCEAYLPYTPVKQPQQAPTQQVNSNTNLLAFVNYSKDIPIENTLVVCAGTQTEKNVEAMKSGFLFFKSCFYYTPTSPWVIHVNDVLAKGKGLPPYLSFSDDIAPKDNHNNRGGIATVPVYDRNKNQDDTYCAAIKGAIAEAQKLELPLLIQPLGIGKYKWPLERAAWLFAKVIKEMNYPVQVMIYNQNPNSTDKKFQEALQDFMQHALKNKYAYQITNAIGRPHCYTVSSAKHRMFRGDQLKTHLLNNLKSQIEETKSIQELKELKRRLKTSDEYKILATAQGFFTKVTGIKTSSEKAFAQMCKDQEHYLKTIDKFSMKK